MTKIANIRLDRNWFWSTRAASSESSLINVTWRTLKSALWTRDLAKNHSCPSAGTNTFASGIASACIATVSISWLSPTSFMMNTAIGAVNLIIVLLIRRLSFSRALFKATLSSSGYQVTKSLFESTAWKRRKLGKSWMRVRIWSTIWKRECNKIRRNVWREVRKLI